MFTITSRRLKQIIRTPVTTATRTISCTKQSYGECPYQATNRDEYPTNKDWWPNQLSLKPLGTTPPTNSIDNGTHDYKKDFLSLDLEEVKADIMSVMTDSKDWWPADYEHYGPFFVRMAWHAAGTYRTFDGRGGAGHGDIRFAPLNSWPDNGNLDKAKRLLWPIKQKYGRKLSWGDLMIFTGNCAIESMGLKPFGFCGGREDVWEPEDDIYWGSEKEWLDANRGGLGDDLDQPLGAVQMGLIYVNPQGPGGNSDPAMSAKDIRTTFSRMAMDDEETVALIAGGHTFGKGHGAADPDQYVGPEPEGASIQEQGFGWKNTYQSGKGPDTITSGLEGAWTNNPIQWDNGYFDNLFKYEWEQTTTPAGAIVWRPTDRSADDLVPDAHISNKKSFPVMFTSDLALIHDSEYLKISKRFHENPDQLADAFSRAWYKLTHRDMGPITRCLGSMVPDEVQIWQDPLPSPSSSLSDDDVKMLKKSLIHDSNLSIGQLVKTAWSSASTFRKTDYRGGANGARLLLSPQNDWVVNDPDELLNTILPTLNNIQNNFNGTVSMADLIVLGGVAAIEEATDNKFTVPFVSGRTDATDEQTDADSFDVLEPIFDGFRNHQPSESSSSPERMLVDKSSMLNLTKAEMTVLIGGMRVLGANTNNSDVGVFTSTPGRLTNDFFTNLLDMNIDWVPTDHTEQFFHGYDDERNIKWNGSRVDLIFGSNSELRALSEYYACDDAKDVFIHDFISAWNKVMMLDRFDVN
jgi:catalase-peroxidase